jgi:hypothetical protein
LRARSFAAVHVDRKAQDESHRLALGRECQQALCVGGEGLACDGLDAGRKPAVGIAGSHSDRLGTEVEPDQRAARRQQRGDIHQGQDRCGRRHGPWAYHIGLKAVD